MTVFLAQLAAGLDLAGALAGGAAAIAIALFALQQRRTRVAVAAWSLFRVRSFTAASLHVMLTNFVMYTTLLYIPFLIVETRGGASGETGLLLGAMTVLMAVLAPVAGTIADRYGRRVPALAGATLVLIASLALLAAVAADSSLLLLALTLALLGLGIGLGAGPAMTAAVESAPPEASGAAAGTSSMMRYLGSILGAGVLAGLLGSGGAEAAGVDLFRTLAGIVVLTAALVVAVSPLIPPLSCRIPGELCVGLRVAGATGKVIAWKPCLASGTHQGPSRRSQRSSSATRREGGLEAPSTSSACQTDGIASSASMCICVKACRERWVAA